MESNDKGSKTLVYAPVAVELLAKQRHTGEHSKAAHDPLGVQPQVVQSVIITRSCHDPSVRPRRDTAQGEPEGTLSKPHKASLHILGRGSNKSSIKDKRMGKPGLRKKLAQYHHSQETRVKHIS